MSGSGVILVGCGRLGSALVTGWLKSGAVRGADLTILSPSKNAATTAARAAGARINPPVETLAEAKMVVLAVKPAKWREAAGPLIPRLVADAVVISVMAGVTSDSLAEAFDGRSVARVMPTTGVATARGAASIWAADDRARAAARHLFDPIATVIMLDDEAMIDVATAVSGSGQAYVFAFAQALAQAGERAGLAPETASVLARATLVSAASSAEADTSLQALIAQVASPGGTTEAGLRALAAAGLDGAVEDAVSAALRRARDLSKD